MSWLIYLFGSGLAFLLGVAIIETAIVTVSRTKKRWLKTLAIRLVLFGLILVAFSAAPLSSLFYVAAVAVTCFWVFAECTIRVGWQKKRKPLRFAAAIVWSLGAGWELVYQFPPKVQDAGQSEIYVIGDSLSAGVGDSGERPWPIHLGEIQEREVVNLSQPGAKSASAIRQVDALPKAGGIVLVEIGGNDLLGSTSALKFEADFEKLLRRVCQPGRAVLLFELPLPPLANEFGRVQRRLAWRHKVPLIPKRLLMGVLAAEGSTIDSLHLSEAGHRRLAEIVAEIISQKAPAS